MKKFILGLMGLTVIGLAVVYSEVEALKTGYAVRDLSLKRWEIQRKLMQLEHKIAYLKSPMELESKLKGFEVELKNPNVLTVARLTPSNAALAAQSAGNTRTLFAKLFTSSTAQAAMTRTRSVGVERYED